VAALGVRCWQNDELSAAAAAAVWWLMSGVPSGNERLCPAAGSAPPPV